MVTATVLVIRDCADVLLRGWAHGEKENGRGRERGRQGRGTGRRMHRRSSGGGTREGECQIKDSQLLRGWKHEKKNKDLI